MSDIIQANIAVQIKTEIPARHRPQVFRTIARSCSENFSLESLFEQHDLVNGQEVELRLGEE
jgi:hypothetical protein